MKTYKQANQPWKERAGRWTTEPPAGPWDDEPDKAQWVDEATDLDCLIVRGPMGALCGYVGVTEGHPLFGASSLYSDVHGGITFAGLCHESPEGPEYGICHIPEPGRPEKVWWLGFDCSHAFDLAPAMQDLGFLGHPTEYRNFAYVQQECAKLAVQLARFGDAIADGN